MAAKLSQGKHPKTPFLHTLSLTRLRLSILAENLRQQKKKNKLTHSGEMNDFALIFIKHARSAWKKGFMPKDLNPIFQKIEFVQSKEN
ncbi:MAG: hypothetical protein J5963_02925 [Schwartzia sp.]|nr:hypothetical protein [Schwartzia sp. (in: firmicutes)]